VRIENRTVKGSFIKRLNRFEGIVVIDGKETLVHIPNTGRCRELLTAGATAILEVRENPKRKTPYELIIVYKGDMPVSIDSHAPNRIVEEAVRAGSIEDLRGYRHIKREVSYGDSRFDLLLKKTDDSNENDSCFVEVKGVTLEVNGTAMFPDAPTERGAKHLRGLIEARRNGYRAVVVFLIQIEGIKTFTPNSRMDPAFAEALKTAAESGVEVYAFNCRVTENEVSLKEKVSVVL